VDLFAYPGEDHFFNDAWPRLMRRTVDFFDTHL
jgi:dipeptidyl aminopeptidase/acylaminoacyl peptidase